MGCGNGFGVFESCGTISKYLEEKYIIADILSKWEKYQSHGINPEGGTWKLQFKLFAFYDPLNPNLSKTEQEFLFEQAFESVLHKRYPADAPMLLKLAALRTQYVVGDYEDGAYISDVIKVHPAQQAQLLASTGLGGGTSTGTLAKAKTMLKGTLRGIGSSTLRRLKGQKGASTMKKDAAAAVSDEEMAVIKAGIVEEWKQIKGMDKDQ